MQPVATRERVFRRGSGVLDYWLAHSEGFAVEPALLGNARVEAVIRSPPATAADAIVVRSGLLGRRRTVAAGAVAAVDPAARVLVLDRRRRLAGSAVGRRGPNPSSRLGPGARATLAAATPGLVRVGPRLGRAARSAATALAAASPGRPRDSARRATPRRPLSATGDRLDRPAAPAGGRAAADAFRAAAAWTGPRLHAAGRATADGFRAAVAWTAPRLDAGGRAAATVVRAALAWTGRHARTAGETIAAAARATGELGGTAPAGGRPQCPGDGEGLLEVAPLPAADSRPERSPRDSSSQGLNPGRGAARDRSPRSRRTIPAHVTNCHKRALRTVALRRSPSFSGLPAAPRRGVEPRRAATRSCGGSSARAGGRGSGRRPRRSRPGLRSPG